MKDVDKKTTRVNEREEGGGSRGSNSRRKRGKRKTSGRKT